MNYGIIPYRVHLSDINICYGNNIESKEGILNTSIKFQEELDERFPFNEGWSKSHDLLETFLDGKWEVKDTNAIKHWYILELLIKGYGTSLKNNFWYPTNIDKFYDYDVFQLFLISLEQKFYLPSSEGFPTIFTILNKNLKEALKIIENDFDESEKKNQFISWINDTIENKQDLVLYYY